MSMKAKGVVVGVILVLIIVGLIFVTAMGRDEGFKAGFDPEFFTRPDGYPILKQKYNFEFSRKPVQLDTGMMYRALADKQVDVIDAFLTDGRIEAYGFKVLEDDKNFFPPYDACPLIRGEALEEHPQLEGILEMLGGKISTELMRKLNYSHDRSEEDKKPYDIAYEFLVEQDLIDPDSKGDGSAGSITVGGKNFTEQDILGEMMAILIEHHSDISVNRKLGLGGTMLCFNALKTGDLDLYAEYTGTGLVNILDEDARTGSQEVYDIVRREFQERWNLVWLEPFGFNNSYTLTMRQEHAERLGIDTISDLAEYVRTGEVKGAHETPSAEPTDD